MARAATGDVWNTSPSLVGRGRERVLLRHLLDRAVEGAAAIAVVTGPAGVGKTTLVRWALAEAHAAGATVLTVSGTEGLLPYGALRRLLRPLADHAGGRLDALRQGGGDSPVDEAEVSGAVTSFMLHLAHRRPLVVAVDDVQGADTPSQRVFEELLASIDEASAQGPVHCLAVMVTRDPGLEEHVVPSVLRLDIARSVPLGCLEEQDVYELLLQEQVRPNPRLVASLMHQTGGLPLLLEAAVQRFAEEAEGRRQLAELPRVRNVTEALRPRFDKIDRAAVDLLAAATVLGEPWSDDALVDITGTALDDVRRLMDSAGAARLVVPAAGGWRFEHPLVRNEVHERLSPGQAQRLHLRAAERMRTTADAGAEDLLAAADHLASAGPAAPRDDVADVCWRAGEIAARSNAWELASRLHSAAVAASDGVLSSFEQAEREVTAGRSAYMANDPAQCERHLSAALSATGGRGEEIAPIRLRAAMGLVHLRLGEAALRPGHPPRVDELEEALNSGGPPELLAEANAVLAEALFVSGGTDRALALIARAREQPDVDACQPARVRLEFSEGLHRLSDLELEDADACFARCATAARACNVVLTQVSAASRRGLVALLRGDVIHGEDLLREAQELGEAHRFWGEAGYAAGQRAHVAALRGTEAASPLLDRALRLHRRSGFTYIALFLGPAEAALASRTGRPDRLDQLLPSPERYRSSALEALRAVEAADIDAARAVVAGARWRHGFSGAPTLTSMAIPIALVMVGDLLEDGTLVGAAREPLETLHQRGVRLAVGWPALLPRLLATVARWEGRLADGRRYLDEASALVDREGLEAERALVALERASHLLMDGDTDSAQAVLAVSMLDLERLGMAGWVRRAEELAGRYRLPAAVLGRRVRDRTLLTTDVVGSTATNVRLGDALYLEQLRIHDRIVRGRMREFGGTELKHTGDGLNIAFEDSGAALRCAVAVQEDLEAWREESPDLVLQARCGLARGSVTPMGGDLHGLVQSEAARICARAGAGEVLASAEVARHAGETFVPLEDLGREKLRGLASPVHLFRARP